MCLEISISVSIAFSSLPPSCSRTKTAFGPRDAAGSTFPTTCDESGAVWPLRPRLPVTGLAEGAVAVEVDFPFLGAACFFAAATAGFDALAAACLFVFGTTVVFDALDDEVVADLEAVAVAFGVFFAAGGCFVAAEERVFLVVRKLLSIVLPTHAREVEALRELPPTTDFPR